jgi:hypothetical protein
MEPAEARYASELLFKESSFRQVYFEAVGECQGSCRINQLQL